MRISLPIITAATVFSFVCASLAVPAYAQTTTTTPNASFEDVCQRIKNRLNIRVGSVTDAKDKNIAKYEAVNKRLQVIVDTAEDDGYDTAGLEAALEESRMAITAYDDANKAYTTQLTATASTVCQSETTYKTNIETTRTLLKAAREAGLDVRSSYQYTVIPELRSYKVWLSEQAMKENV